MSDERIRDLERRYNETKSEADGLAWVTALLRSSGFNTLPMVKHLIRLEWALREVISVSRSGRRRHMEARLVRCIWRPAQSTPPTPGTRRNGQPPHIASGPVPGGGVPFAAWLCTTDHCDVVNCRFPAIRERYDDRVRCAYHYDPQGSAPTSLTPPDPDPDMGMF